MQVSPFNHLFKFIQVLEILNFFRGGEEEVAFFKIEPNFEFFLNYRLQLHGEQLSILHSQLLTRLLYYMSPNMVYTRILGSRQIGNYLAGHVKIKTKTK